MGIKDKAFKFYRSKRKVQILFDRFIEFRVKCFKKIRLSSDPFISGDSFRALADVKLDVISDRSIRKAELLIYRAYKKSKPHVILFIDLHCTLELESQARIVNWLSELKRGKDQKLSVVFHNHDIVPTENFFLSISRLSISCYSPNVMDNFAGVTPIPLGIENRYLRRNGIIRHFPKKDSILVNDVGSRTIGLFSAFKIETNLLERQQAADTVIQFGHEFRKDRIYPWEFRRKLTESLFVLSPPGNGIDCHRTWESIYLGAVPVIKRSKLAESIYSDLPIQVVDDWVDICSKSRKQLEDSYLLMRKRSNEKAYFEFWKLLISG
jgi:hypothetical protein